MCKKFQVWFPIFGWRILLILIKNLRSFKGLLKKKPNHLFKVVRS
nr:MAG TPA: hypothetical protein [Bacteriophage sp.]